MKKQIDDDEFFDDDGYCDECGGSGWLMECCDDICHGLGYCIHGDGDVDEQYKLVHPATTFDFPLPADPGR